MHCKGSGRGVRGMHSSSRHEQSSAFHFIPLDISWPTCRQAHDILVFNEMQGRG